jgi:hypothetical protein
VLKLSHEAIGIL